MAAFAVVSAWKQSIALGVERIEEQCENASSRRVRKIVRPSVICYSFAQR